MKQLATATEIWNDTINGVQSFFDSSIVQTVGPWLDNAIIAILAIVFFKYILPALRENEANKKLVEELQATLASVVKITNDAIITMTGVNLNLEDKLIKLSQAINIAFLDSNISITAKNLVNTILQSIITKTPINISDQLEDLSDEAVSLIKEVQVFAEEALEEITDTALDELANEVDLVLIKEETSQEE